MPRKNGFEVLAWVRAQAGLKRLPVVVLSSSKEFPVLPKSWCLDRDLII
jgi:CheY-like chemotaxis protein